MESFCGDSNEPSSFIKGREFLGIAVFKVRQDFAPVD
jgi:hypothetical protein